ncbi:MAG: hypothetical protein KF814_14900 [Nitrospiraceae bacterium]|nr:hypothetical protein [Nitrospiraceae bacterium]
MKPTILYILSTNYAGSHFLSLLVGSHSRAVHIGEVNHLRKRVDRGTCHTCGSLDACRLLGGIAPEQVDQVYDIVLSRVGAGISLLVDNSKRLPWAGRFVDDRRYAIKYLHLIRDPRALLRRWALYYPAWPGQLKQRWQALRAFPHRALPLATMPQTQVYLYRWLAENQRITEFLHRRQTDTLLCTYEELATDQAVQVQRTMDWLGLPYEPSQLEYWHRDHHGTQKQDYEWIKQKQAHYFDQRWKTFLTPEDARAVERNQDVQRYLRGLGLTMTDDGLVRDGSQTCAAAGC